MDASRLDNLDPLVAAASGGDQAAFCALVSQTSNVVSAIALAIVRDLDLSRDVAQDVFLAAWRDLRKLRNPASFLPWLRQMTRNRAHHVLRTHLRQKRRELSGSTDVVFGSLVDVRPDPATRLMAAEDRAALVEALADLPDETREVLTLYYREGQSTAQVALLLDLDEAAVRKRLSRARATLRAGLLERAARAMENTAPGTSFTTAVMMALPLTATTAGPATAAVAAKGAIQTGLFAKLLLATGGGAMVGAAGGIAGVLFGSRRLLGEARDEKERRDLYRHAAVSVAVVIAFAALFPISGIMTQSKVAPALVFAGFIGALAILQHLWLPRIVARRHEAEMCEDPARAVRRRCAERRAAILGWSLGLTFGTLGLLLGLYWS